MSKILATIDLGSNSFHLLISEVKNDGEIITLSKQKQKVQLRKGLKDDLTISEDAQDRAIECLKFFAQEIQKYQVDYIDAVGTYTLRKAKKNIKTFKKKLEQVLGAKIKIISGQEEARLVYLGSISNYYTNQKTLVIDIGGGSTELIIGKADKILISRSLEMGCVGIQKDCFANDKLDFANFYVATNKAKDKLTPILKKYKKISWSNVLGSSGTILALAGMSEKLTGDFTITKDFLNAVITNMINKKEVKNISFDGLREDRENILAGGISILYAIFDCLEISHMDISNGALREGLLYELIKRRCDIVVKNN